MYDIKMDGSKQAPVWFWICLALLLIGSLIAYIILYDDRRDQNNMEKKTTFLQYNDQRHYSQDIAST